MRLCVFEDRAVSLLEPLTLTRPAFELRCGVSTLLERQQHALAATETAVLVRSGMTELCRLNHPQLAVNDPDWLRPGETVFVNARWLPPCEGIGDVNTPHAAMVEHQLAYLVLPTTSQPPIHDIDEWAAHWSQTLPHRPAGGVMMDYPWDLVERNAETLCRDAVCFAATTAGQRSDTPIAVLGPSANLLVHADTTIEPFVVADTRKGPVLIDRGAVIQSFSRLEGPCYVGPESWIIGAKLRGGTIGPGCRIGGEVEASIVQGFSNKYHDGFLGHSYLGEWVNIGAGTQVSDLRNDYGTIKVIIGGERIATGLTKVGVFIGDHSKIGLSTLLNSGTAVGAFSNLLPSGTFLPPAVPSFCTVRYGQIQERTDLQQMFNTAGAVMARRGRELTGAHVEFFFNLCAETAAARGKVIRDNDTCHSRNLTHQGTAPAVGGASRGNAETQAISSRTTLPCTSVSRKSLPA